MIGQINSRIVIVTVEVDPLAGNVVAPQLPNSMAFEGLDIRAQGQKFAGTETDTCILQISNLTRDQKNWLLTVASPLTTSQQPGRKPVLVTLSVGRESVFPPFLLFQGYCWASRVTMPPDIGIILTSTANNFQAAALQPQDFGALTTVQTIASQIAAKYQKTLNIVGAPKSATKQIANFHYTGGLQTAINKLARAGVGQYRVQCNTTTLSVYDVSNTVYGPVAPFTLNTSTGMVSIPEVDEMGVKATCLIIPQIQVGSSINVQSTVNPAANVSNYYISSLRYHVTNRDDPFWYELYCSINTGLQPSQ